MRNIADIPTRTKWAALAYLESFGIKLPDALFEEWAAWALDSIGRNTAEIRVAAKVREDGEISLPCEIDSIKSVTLDVDIFETWKGTKIDEDGKNTEIATAWMDLSPMSMRSDASYVDFEILDDNTLKVNPRLVDSYIYVRADALLVDKEGEQLFTDKQIRALSEYVIAFKAKRDYLSGNPTIDHVTAMKEAHKLVAASRVPTYVSDNEIDRILNVKVSFDRKMFNKDFKIND